MKTNIIRFAFMLCLLFTASISFAQNTVIGKWLSESKKGITEIYEVNGKYYGKLVWLKEPTDANGKAKLDENNKEKNLRTAPILGLVILKDFVLKDGEWKDGTIYDPENGKTYKCTMWLKDANTIKVRGYWGPFYRTQVWTRSK
jgi:uncharacterized protein (DUF2147 family)